MIDVFAIATNGYISIEQKAFSVAVDGYYPNEIVTVLQPTADGIGRQRVVDESRQRKIAALRRDDDELLFMIKAFLETWH